MDIQIGDRVTYKLINVKEQGIKIKVINNKVELDDFLLAIRNQNTVTSIEILKIERPKYEVVEEKKELLTEEEKEFLKQYIKIIKALKNGEIITICRTEEDIKLKLSTSISYKIEAGPKFGNMKMNIDYTLQELGLEES